MDASGAGVAPVEEGARTEAAAVATVLHSSEPARLHLLGLPVDLQQITFAPLRAIDLARLASTSRALRGSSVTSPLDEGGVVRKVLRARAANGGFQVPPGASASELARREQLRAFHPHRTLAASAEHVVVIDDTRCVHTLAPPRYCAYAARGGYASVAASPPSPRGGGGWRVASTPAPTRPPPRHWSAWRTAWSGF